MAERTMTAEQAEMYTYKDFFTGKLRYTKGEFVKWTKATGPLNVRYAAFQRRRSMLFIPEYLLTRETREALLQVCSQCGVRSDITFTGDSIAGWQCAKCAAASVVGAFLSS